MLDQTVLFISAEPALAHRSHDNPKNRLSGSAPKIIPGSSADTSEPKGPIIIARPGETPPPPPGQLIDEKPLKFTPEYATTITKKDAVTMDAPRDTWPELKPGQRDSATQQPGLTEAEKKFAALVRKQELEKLKLQKQSNAKIRAPKHDKILSNKEVEAAIIQLGGSLKDLPVLEQPTPIAEAAVQKTNKPLSEQKQAEVDVFALLKSEATKVSKKPSQEKKSDTTEIEDALSMLAEGINTKPRKKSLKKAEPQKKGKPPVDDLEAALANIDSLSLTTPETPQTKSGKDSASATALPGLEPGPELPGLEPGPALPGLAPGPLAIKSSKKSSRLATQKSALDKLPPIKSAKTTDRLPTKIGTRLQKEADRVAKNEPGFIDRMTNVLQLNDSAEKSKSKKSNKNKIPKSTSPESPSQWAAKVVKTTRLDQAPPTPGDKRKKIQGPNKFLSGASLTLGQSLKIGKEPLTKPKSGPDTRKPCIRKRDGALLFCVETVDWAATIKPYF
jgi:hypothetical protein